VLFDIELERVIRLSGIEADPLRERVLLDLILRQFEMLSDYIRTCELAESFHRDTGVFDVDLPDNLPSLEEMGELKESLQVTAREMERLFDALVSIKTTYATKYGAVWSELFGSDSSGLLASVPELDREAVRTALRERVFGSEHGSSVTGDVPERADSDGGERVIWDYVLHLARL
jgi:hypothetical protein